MSEEKKDLSIEESFDKLENILREMEQEDTGLEKSFQLYEEGMKLLKGAEESIDRVEKQIRVLSGREQTLD